MQYRVIPIAPAAPSVPNAPALPQAQAPQLSGEPARVQRVLQALDAAMDGPALGFSLPLERWLRELRLDSANAEVTLQVTPRLGTAPAELAFDTLRRLLPDTDIYVIAAAA
jgi:hypothetical protein